MNLRLLMRRFRSWIPASALLVLLNFPAGAATNVVTSLADSGPGSLRQAISNALPGDTITFATNGTITLTSGELLIRTNLNILGPGAGNVAVSGNGASRVFNISPGATSSISGLTIFNGRAPVGTPAGNGGGIYNAGVLTINHCSITGNSAPDGANVGTNGTDRYCCLGQPGGAGGMGDSGGSGGGIWNSGQLRISHSQLTGNRTGHGRNGGNGGRGADNPSGYAGTGGNAGNGGSGGSGAGLYNFNSGHVTLSNCVFSDNITGGGGTPGTPGLTGNRSSSFPAVPGYNGQPGSNGFGGSGGAVWNGSGVLSATACVFERNASGSGNNIGTYDINSTVGGGAVGNGGHLYLSGCYFNGNRATNRFGGAVFNSSTAIVFACTFTNNRATYIQGAPSYGGGIFSNHRLAVSNSTFSGSDNFSGNFAFTGGGICAFPVVELSHCTFSKNRAYSSGGAIYATGLLTMVSCTVYSNYALGIGGVDANYGTAYSRNSLAAGNSLGDMSSYPNKFTSGGYNLVGDGLYAFSSPSPTDRATNIILAPLANNGGPTLTHALLPGSPALDAGDDTLTGTDQRGFPRRSGAHVDIGAFEFTSPTSAGLRKLSNGAITLTTLSDVPFNVVAHTNLTAPSNQWIHLGPATATAPGVYEFTDPTATNNPRRYFRWRWP